MAPPTPSIIPPDVRLKRFLHFGRELPAYISGYHDFHEYIEMKNLNAIEELLANSAEEKQSEIINHIIKAAMDGYVVYPNCLAFALAVCARQRTSEKLRHAAYAALATVCKTPKDLFEFVNFASKLTSGTKGWGSGIRTAISNWYLKRDSMELAEFVSKYRGFLNWTHRDLVKLVHPKSEEPEKAVILKYILKGLEEAKENAPKDEKTQKVLEYLQRIEEFKHLSAPQQAANLISIHGYSLELVPQHNGLIKSHEVWMSLVRILPLGELLENIKRLSCYGFLKANEPMEKVIIERLHDEAAITESNLHPFEVFMYLRKYEEHAKDQAERMNGLVKSGRLTKVIKPPAKPNQNIIAAMNSLLNATFKLLVPTGMRYLLAIDVSMRSTDKVVGAPYVTPIQAAVLLAMTLSKAEKNVKVVTFPALDENNVNAEEEEAVTMPEVMVPLDIDSNISIQANLDKLKEVKGGPSNVKQPLLWAMKEKIPADVVIVVSGSGLGRDYVSTVKEYREAMNLPNTKFIGLVLTSMIFRAEDTDAGVFHIGGFGGKVGKVIEAFSRGAF